MSVTYRIVPELGLIQTSCIGDTTLEDVLGHFEELRSLESLPQPLDVRLDFTRLTALPRLEQLELAASTTASLTPMLKWGAMAIVVDDDFAFEVSRVYEALISHYFEGVRTFGDPAKADAWLEEVRVARANAAKVHDG